jgi:hypothetical protein
VTTTPQITRAKLIPMLTQDGIDTDVNHHLTVQFNPATLRVTLANTLKADNPGGSGSTGAAAQYIDKSESTLSVELVYDTSVERSGVAANTDVRLQTQRIAAAFMAPQPPEPPRSQQPRAPQRCRFQWGRFQFTGMVSSYTETLDFFAPEGIPLRATLALTLKEDRYQFDFNEGAGAAARPAPRFASGGDDTSAADVAQTAGLHPQDWRVIADFNRLDNPRLTSGAGVLVPSVSASASASLSFGVRP